MKKLIQIGLIFFLLISCGVSVSEENQKAKEINDKIDNIHGVWLGDDNPKKITFQGNKFRWMEMDDVEYTGSWEMGRHSKIYFTFDDDYAHVNNPIEGEIMELEEDKLVIKSEDINFSSSRFKRN